MTLFQSGHHDLIVVVNDTHTPLGTISSRHLLSSLLQKPLTLASESSRKKSQPNHKSAPKIRTNSSVCPDLGDNWQSLLTPLTLVPSHLKLTEFAAYLEKAPRDHSSIATYAVIDPSGKFLGLLNTQQILQNLLTQNLATPKGQVTLATSEELLRELLEQFPLPVMVQTKQGQILQQNRSWREQIGEFIPPDHASACLLTAHNRFPSVASSVRVGQRDKYTSSEYLRETAYLVENLLCSQWLQSIPSKFTPNHSFPNTAELHPLMPSPESLIKPKSDKGRVWQFVKCPLTSEDLGGEIYLVLATDVTEQQRLCQELAAKNADLVQLNRLKDEFLACISHELKSPLTAVVGLSSLLGEQKVGELNTRQVHYAELIYRSGRQLMTLVNDLLDLTRLETGQLKLSFLPLNIKNICERAYHSIIEKYQSKTDVPLSINLDIEPALKFILADELRLHQMLVHLLDNAMKFTQAEGKVGIRVSRWENWIAFTVWDTGIGIPEESQHLIFQKFQQLENPLTRKFEGTGLGLVLTQRLARAHGGDISFISKEGQGSQFTLLLPPSPDANLGKLEGHSSQSLNPMVLIVEAIPRYIEDLIDKLTQLGYRVVIARTGTEAVEKARQLSPYAILLNPLLPLLSGWDVLTLLKSDPETRTIPVFVTTSQGNQPFNEPNQADGFLSVPVDLPILQTILASLKPPAPVTTRSLTLLRLYPECTQDNKQGLCSPFEWAVISQLSPLNHRILEADDLEQAEMLSHVWQIDVIVLDGRYLDDPTGYLRSLSEYAELASLPLITLDLKTTEAANQVDNLLVFPCLIPEDEQNAQQLWEVIEIAVSSN
ncbi:histidine kinase [Rippkaea orientalis PCC 8801]|uniref:histidine kinase n=2 Tax=Rippkaea TaxID=2546365 RepID=B7K6A5_RIPO1|nr:histidine kinase [Rippkaea orientalis PCC 8801]